MQGYRPEFSDEELAAMASGTRLRLSAPFLEPLLVDVRPLSEPEIEDARLDARARARFLLAQRGLGESALDPARGLLGRMFERCIVLRAALCPGASGTAAPFFASLDEVEELDASTVTTLFQTWAMAQDRACPVDDDPDAARALIKTLEKRRTPLDRARASHANALCAFYDVTSVRQLTDLQVIHFLKLTEPN